MKTQLTQYIVKDDDGVYLLHDGKIYSWVRDPNWATTKLSKYDAKQHARRVLGEDAVFTVVDKQPEVSAFAAKAMAVVRK